MKYKYLFDESFPLSNKYDPMWIFKNEMGSNVLWPTEWVCQEMKLKPDMHVLDIGCGKALSSIFLAKEYGVKVIAGDLWTDPSENWERIKECGLENDIIPIKVDARQLPFAKESFDAIIFIDSYHYFGDNDYSTYFLNFLKIGGMIGIVQMCTLFEREDIDNNDIPEYLKGYYQEDLKSKHIDKNQPGYNTLRWWKKNLEDTKRIKILTADVLKNGIQKHVKYLEDQKKAGFKPYWESAFSYLNNDVDKYLGFMRIIGRVDF